MDEGLIVNRIKNFRKKNGLTLQKLADLTGFTRSYLSHIENSKKAPPIGTVTKIANAMGIDPVVILTGDNGQRQSTNISFVKKGERKEASRVATQYGYVYETIAHKKTGKAFEAYILTLPFEKNAIFMHEGEEMIFVLEGTAICIYGEDKIVMEQGDCVHFNSEIPHTAISLGDEKAKVMCVICSPIKTKGGGPDSSVEVLSIVKNGQ